MAAVKKIKIENSEFENKSGFGKRYSYVILKALKNAPTKGLTVGEMRGLSDIIDIIEKGKDDSVFELKASELKIVLEKTRSIQWVIFDKEIIALDDYLGSL